MAYPQTLTGIFPVDPIDSLQTLYNIWKSAVSVNQESVIPLNVVNNYTESTGVTVFDFTRCIDYVNQQMIVFDLLTSTLF